MGLREKEMELEINAEMEIKERGGKREGEG